MKTMSDFFQSLFLKWVLKAVSRLCTFSIQRLMQGSYPAAAQGNLKFDIDIMKTVARYFRCTLRPQDPSLSHGTVYSWGAWKGFRTTISALPREFSSLMWRSPWELLPLKLVEGVLWKGTATAPLLCRFSQGSSRITLILSLLWMRIVKGMCVALPAQ